MGFYSSSYLYEPDYEMLEEYAKNYSPGFWQMSGYGIEDSFQTSSIGLGLGIAKRRLKNDWEVVYPEELWRQGDHYRPGIEYEDGMSEQDAIILAERYDQRQMTEQMLENSGFLGWFGYITGSVLGAIPDPINLVPFGMLLKGGHMLKLGKLAKHIHTKTNKMVERGIGRIAMGGFEGGVGAMALQPGLAYERKLYQERYDAQTAAMDVLVGIGAGAMFTTVLEGARKMIRPRFSAQGEWDDLDIFITEGQESAVRRSLNNDLTIEEQVAAARQSIQSLNQGENPDVARVRPRVDEAAEELAEETIPESNWYILDEDGKFISGHDKFTDAKGGKIFKNLGKGDDTLKGIYEYSDESGSLFLGKKKDLSKVWDDTFNPKKPDYTAASPEDSPHISTFSKADEEVLNLSDARATAELSQEFNTRAATHAETVEMQEADIIADRHNKIGEAAEEMAACVLGVP